MGALKNIFNKIGEMWKPLSKGRKVGIIVLASGIIMSLGFFLISINKVNYSPLFVNMATEDLAKVVDELKQQNISYKLEGNSVLVPEDKVDDLRLTVASSGLLPSDGQGWELFDQSSFGRTDTETQILYQRAMEGELARTIRGMDQVESDIVHLVLPESSVFIRDQEQARASVTLKLKNNAKLSPDQVKSIIALVSGSVKNLPKENVVVVDSNYNYLSENLFNEDMTSAASASNRQDMTKQFEFKIQDNILKMLESVFGQDKAQVTVSADLDFDSKEVTSITYDPNKVIANQNIIRENIAGDSSPYSGSPIDNQMVNSIPASSGTTGTTDTTGTTGTPGTTGTTTVQSSTTATQQGSWRYEETTNYDVGQTTDKTIKAPGEVKKMSVSVVINGALSDTAKTSVTNMVAAAMGYDQTRGDVVNIEAMPFDDSAAKKVEADLKAMDDQKAAAERRDTLITYVGYPAAGLLALIILIVLISKIKSKPREAALTGGVDILVNEPVTVSEVMKNPIILDEEEDKQDLASEIKKYANKKPDQVVEIIKSWMAEDER